MKKATKIWLLVAASLIIFGIIIFGGVMALLKWDIWKLTTIKYETNTYEISEDFNNLNINTDTADIVFFVSDDEKCKVICYEDEKMKHSVGVSEGTLSVNMADMRKWYDHISIFSAGNPMITVYLPKKENISLSVKNSTGDIGLPKDITFESIDISGSTGDVKCYASATGMIKIKRTTGDISVENISAESLDLSVSTGRVNVASANFAGDVKLRTSTGDVKLDVLNCKNLFSECGTGDIALKNVIATDIFDIDTDTGKVTFDRCDANEIYVETDTGKVTGTLLSDKIFYAKSDTGKVEVPKSTIGGKCEIETDTGDIRINILG